MTNTSATPLAFRRPLWLSRTDVVARGAFILALVAAVGGGVIVAVFGAPVILIVGIVVEVLGVIISWRFPWLGIGVILLGCVVASSEGQDLVVDWTIAVVALFALTLRGLQPLWGVLIVGGALYGIVGFTAGRGALGPETLAAVAGSLAAGAAASAITTQQRYWTSLEDRARDAIATRELEAARRVAEERLRIARDLHDVVGHQVAVASMQLGAVEVMVRSSPDAAARAAEMAREALSMGIDEMRRVLAVLRDEQSNEGVHGVRTLPALIASFGEIGRPVITARLDQDFSPDPAVDVTIYRVVQEALTNAARHGSGATTLALVHESGLVTITVSNPVRACTEEPQEGFGLRGMAERLAAVCGERSYDVANDRFTLTLRVPTTGSRGR